MTAGSGAETHGPGAGLDLVVADAERRPPGDDDVHLLMPALRLVVLDVEVLARVHHDRVDADRADAQRSVERLPAPERRGDERLRAQVDDGHVNSSDGDAIPGPTGSAGRGGQSLGRRRYGARMDATDARVAVVTGANRGIGLEVARGLARAGLHVVCAARDAAAAEATAAALRGEGGSARARPSTSTTRPASRRSRRPWSAIRAASTCSSTTRASIPPAARRAPAASSRARPWRRTRSAPGCSPPRSPRSCGAARPAASSTSPARPDRSRP